MNHKDPYPQGAGAPGLYVRNTFLSGRIRPLRGRTGLSAPTKNPIDRRGPGPGGPGTGAGPASRARGVFCSAPIPCAPASSRHPCRAASRRAAPRAGRRRGLPRLTQGGGNLPLTVPLILCLGALFALGSPLAAATLHFVVVETGADIPPAGEPGEYRPAPAVFESSLLWETGLFDVCFEAGHIVSNSPVLRMNRAGGADFPGKEAPRGEFPGELLPDLEAAGGADYLILALLAYPAGIPGEKTMPRGVSLRLYAPVRGGNPGAGEYRFVYEGNSALGNSFQGGNPQRRNAQGKNLQGRSPQGNNPQGIAASGETGTAGGGSAPAARQEGELEQAKRLIRGLMPHVKD